MSSSNVNAFSAGVQQLYDSGLLPSGLNASTIKGSSASQLSQLAKSAVALQQIGILFGDGKSTDSATLSQSANDALLQEINPSSSSSSSTDPLTAAVNNALTSSLNAAVSRFLPQNSSTAGSINLLG